MLRKFGYRDALDARDGEKAVAIMAAPRSPPVNVILMDLWMPLMDGYEATRRILEMPQYAPGPDGRKKLTILAVSADATAEAMERSRSVGMEGFMSKPYRMVDLERLLVDFCSPPPG
jgi:CheY-like chemotaxis protein